MRAQLSDVCSGKGKGERKRKWATTRSFLIHFKDGILMVYGGCRGKDQTLLSPFPSARQPPSALDAPRAPLIPDGTGLDVFCPIFSLFCAQLGTGRIGGTGPVVVSASASVSLSVCIQSPKSKLSYKGAQAHERRERKINSKP